MENLGKNYYPVTPEEKENIMKKLAPSARGRVKEIYRFLPTADDLKKMDTGDVACLRVVHKSKAKESLKAGCRKGSDAGVSALLHCILMERDDNARLRYIDARLKAGGYTGLRTINRT